MLALLIPDVAGVLAFVFLDLLHLLVAAVVQVVVAIVELVVLAEFAEVREDVHGLLIRVGLKLAV